MKSRLRERCPRHLAPTQMQRRLEPRRQPRLRRSPTLLSPSSALTPRKTAGDIAYSLNDSTTYAILLAEGLRSELLRAVMEQLLPPSEEEEEDEGGELSTAGDNKTFLASKLRFLVDGSGQEICVDRENNGVMMGWERGLMERSARKLCEAFEGRREGREMEEELNVVNVGFGLGIVSPSMLGCWTEEES